MECITLGCQVCLTTFNRVGILKGHMYSQAHQKKSKDIFKQDVMKVQGIFPSITLINQWSKGDIRQPITGLTLCFSQKTRESFYLCQVCEEKCPSHKIVYHLSTVDHCRNHFSHTNPNALRFSWIPSMNVEGVFRPEVTNKLKESSGGQLQVLDLPGHLWEKLDKSTYSEVMCTLGENEKLLKLLEAVKPKQMTIQTYQRDSNREHPLLGMQHLVECICVGQTEKRHYLCTLCHLTLAAHAIVNHVLSFDHIFCYFRAWHPSTLLVKESYKDYSKLFSSMMLDFAKQTEQIHGTANADMTQVRLEPTKFKSVNFTCYADALKELESIRKENKENSLIVSVTPGKKLALKKPESKEKENEESRLITSVTPGNKLEFRPGLYKLRCQNCSMSFMKMTNYCRHLSNYTHKQRVKKFFGGGSICFPPFPTGADRSDQTEWKPSLGLYKNLVNCSRGNQPLVGVPLVVTCVCTQVQEEPIYVCFACRDCFTESFLRQHFDSQKHLIHTLLYQNPWRLTLGWEHRLDEKHLRSMAWEEEKEKPHQRMLKVLDMPNRMFQRLVISLSYQKVMESLSLQHIILMRDVPPYETYSKLKENDRFPLLGRQFLVMHDVCVVGQQPTVAFMCLLCEMRLPDEECYAHEFSRKHIATYLDRFHPGSLDSSTDDESFLDLAKQAARYHTISHVQVMKLKKPIMEPCTYRCALFILTSANTDGKTQLDPPIIPKIKLVSRKKLKDEDKDHVRDNVQKNSGMMECLETTSQESTDNSETTLIKTVEVGAEVTDTHTLKSEENAEKGDDKKTLTLFHLTSEKGRGAFSDMSSEDRQQSETCQTIKEEKMEMPTSGEPTENSQNADKNGIRNERNKSSKDVLTPKEEVSSKDICPVEDEGQEKSHKQQRLTFKEAPQNLPISGQREVTTLDKGESGKPSHKTAKDEASSKVDQQQADQLWQYLKRKNREPVVGLSALLECSFAEHDPIYLCKCCSLKIPEKDIISHVTGVEHQKMYLVGLKKIPPPPGMNQGKTMRHFAGLFEQEHGYGEAQIVELDDEIYNNFSKQDFDSVLQTVKALQDQQDSGHELPSTSALSGVQPVDTIVPLHAQHEVCLMKDNYQVMKMETDDSEDSSSVTTSMSMKTETTSNTTKVPPESNEAHVKVSKAPGPSPNALSKSTEDKAEIISNTTVGPCKIAATSKVVGRSKTAASSDSTVTIPTKSMTAISEFTTKSSNSTPDTTKSTAPNTKSRDTASKCTATTSTSCDTISRTTSTTTSVTSSKTQESRTRAATEVRTASCKADGPSKAESTLVFEAAGRTTPGFKTETTGNKTKVPPESNEAHGKASKAPGPSTNTLSKSSVDKAKIISNTTVGPFKIAATSVGGSETAASSDSTFTTKSSNSTPDTTKSTAPISQLKAVTASCHTPNTKSRDTASKCTATTSTSCDTISRTTSTTTSVTSSKTQESGTRAATEVRTASCKPAGPSKAAASSKAESTLVFEAAGKIAPGFQTATTSNTTKVAPESNEAHGKASKSPGPSPNTLSKSSEDKAEIISNATVAPFKIAATSKVVGRSETAASSDSTVRIATKSTAPNTKSREPASKYTATTATSCDTISRTTSATTSVILSKTLESRTRAATEVRTASSKAAAPSKAESTLVLEATSRTAPGFKIENASKCSESESISVVASQTVVKSVATAKMPENIKASVKTAHMKNSVRSTADVAPNIHKSKAPAATHLTMPKNPPAAPLHICTNEKMPSESSPKVGLNQLIKVSCGQRKQVYCQLCSVRLLKSEHACSASHQLNYVKMKYPEWTCKPSELESKLHEVVKNLAVVERNVGSLSFPTVKVTIDVYKELADLSAEKALERLKAMLEKGLGVSSPTTSNPGGILRRQVSGADQHEASSPDDEIESSQSLAVGQFHRTQSVESSEPEANDQILDQLNSCSILNNNETLASSCIQDVGVAAAKMDRPQGCAPPPATDAQPPGCKETPGWKQQQERSPPEIQDTRKVLEGSQRTSPVKFFKPDQLFSAATVNTKKPDQPRPSQKAENALPMILLGESTEGCSHLSFYLKVMGSDDEPIIGMDFVWECRGLSSKPFFLCESCKVMISSKDICQHMISKDHQINFILSQKSQFLYFWPESYLLQHPDVYLEKWMKLELLKDIAQCLSEQERYVKTDAQLILLVPELYEHVRTAPFSKALEIVKNIKKEQKLSVSCQPSCTAQRKVQLPEAQHSPEESLSMEMQPAQALETNRRSDDEPPDLRPSVSPHQRPIQELPVNQAGVHPESTSFSVCPQTLPVSSNDQHLPTRKRPVVESIETLMRDCTDHPNLNDPMPAKRKPTYSKLQPIVQPSPDSVSESTSVNPAATSVPLSPQDEDIAPGSDEQDIPIHHLIALVKERKSALNASRCTAAPGNGETMTSCSNTSLESGVERRQDSKSVQTTSELAMKRRRRKQIWDEHLKMIKETENPVPAYALEKFNSSLDGSSSARGDLLFGATEAKAVGTADPSDPQHQRSINTQTTFGNTSQSNPSSINCAVVNSNPGHIPQPRDYTENDSTGSRQLPINAIVTVRSNQPEQQFLGGNNEEDLAEVNRGSLVTHNFSSVAEICPSNVLGGYGRYNQMVYVTNQQSGYFASETVGSYATPGHLPVHTGSSFQFEGYPTGGLYFPSQIHPHQETTRQSLQYFGNSLATQTPPERMRLVHLDPPAIYRPPAANMEVICYLPATNTQVMSQASANSFYASEEF